MAFHQSLYGVFGLGNLFVQQFNARSRIVFIEKVSDFLQGKTQFLHLTYFTQPLHLLYGVVAVARPLVNFGRQK